MIIYDDEGYYFDRIYILSTREKQELIKHLFFNEMITDCRSFNIINTDWQEGIYRSRIEIVAPTTAFLKILFKNESLIGSSYKISKIEIARDKIFRSANYAEREVETLFKTIRKRYSFGLIYEGKPVKTKKECVKDRIKGLFARRTYYSSWESEDQGNRKGNGKRGRFKNVIYARYSKINNAPCVHSEWRIVGASLIAKKTGIRGIGDLVNFDFHWFINEMNEKYVVHEKIDNWAVGRLIKGYDGRRKLSRRQKIGVGVAAQMLRSCWQIETFSDLVRFFVSEKKIINKKRGKKSDWDNMVLGLKAYSKFKVIIMSHTL
ncbi:MAG: hypothetical protein GX625_04305 [Clostridiaceae bacterium]|nr:hypothetical protein [Clostridiaceae bacterium]